MLQRMKCTVGRDLRTSFALSRGPCDCVFLCLHCHTKGIVISGALVLLDERGWGHPFYEVPDPFISTIALTLLFSQIDVSAIMNGYSIY